MNNEKIGYILKKVRKALITITESLLEDNHYRNTYLAIKQARDKLNELMMLMKNEDYNNLKIGKDE